MVSQLSALVQLRNFEPTCCFADVSVVSPHMGQNGWPFATADAFPGADADPLYGAQHVKDLYFKAKPDYDGR